MKWLKFGGQMSKVMITVSSKKYFYGYTFISAGGINPYSVVS